MRTQTREMHRLLHRFEPCAEERIALCKLLTAIEDGEVTTETAAAALHRHGENLAKAGGVEAMRAALGAVCAARPDRTPERRAMITAAWAARLETKP